MNKVWVYKNPDDSYTIFYIFEGIPESLQNRVIEIDTLPEGSGILRRSEDGTFYYEPFPEPVDPPDPIDPPDPPEPTIEQRLEQIELTSAQTQVQGDYVAFLVETLLAK